MEERRTRYRGFIKNRIPDLEKCGKRKKNGKNPWNFQVILDTF